ncbi:MAG: hypothetical protein R3D05_15560 [Dongiaceae bacterium]
MRSARLKGSAGTGGQLISLSGAGLASWKQRSSNPPAFYFRGIQLLAANLSGAFSTQKPTGSWSTTG